MITINCDGALAEMLVYDNNLRNIMALAVANNAKPDVETIISSR